MGNNTYSNSICSSNIPRKVIGHFSIFHVSNKDNFNSKWNIILKILRLNLLFSPNYFEIIQIIDKSIESDGILTITQKEKYFNKLLSVQCSLSHDGGRTTADHASFPTHINWYKNSIYSKTISKSAVQIKRGNAGIQS